MEHFNCDLEYMKNIIFICGTMLDILQSTFENISYEETLNIICNKLSKI
jgi:hypothetical protein